MIHKNKDLQKYQTQGEISFASLTICEQENIWKLYSSIQLFDSINPLSFNRKQHWNQINTENEVSGGVPHSLCVDPKFSPPPELGTTLQRFKTDFYLKLIFAYKYNQGTQGSQKT